MKDTKKETDFLRDENGVKFKKWEKLESKGRKRDMELKREDMKQLKVKSRAASQVTFDADVNVPDVKPDVGRMIQSKGEVVMDEVRLSEGHAYIRGNLQVDLLYVSEDTGKIFSMQTSLPMDETLNLEGIASGDKMCLRWEIEDLSIHLIHSRKLNIKAIVTLYAVVDEVVGVRLPVAVEKEEVSVKKKNVRLMSLAVHKKDTLRIREEITLAANKPNIAELVWSDLEIRGLDLRPEQDQIKARGELAVFALYVGDEESGQMQWLEHALPFTGEAECPGSMEDMIPQIETSVLSQSLEVKPDADGEERILFADVVLELDMKLYREEEHELLLDVYTPKKELLPRSHPEELETRLIRNYSRCRLSDQIEVNESQGKVLQICHSSGRVKVDKTKIIENGIQVDGVVHMKILYIIGNDEMPFYSMEAMIPFSHVIEAGGITEDCIYHLRTDLEQLSTSMAESNRLEVKAVIGLNALVLCRREELIMDRVEEQPLDMETLRTMPGVTVYMVKSGDTLWDIARRHYTTVEEIMSLNELTDSLIMPGQPLLLVKASEFPLAFFSETA